MPLLEQRLNRFRNDFHLPDGLKWPNLLSNGKAELIRDLSDHTQGTHRYEFGEKTTQLRTEVIAATDCDRIALEIPRCEAESAQNAIVTFRSSVNLVQVL
jgi:hypothetical protein